MSFDQRLWSSTESIDRPMTLVLRSSNFGFSPAMYPSSVVHTGVKSFGWENRMAHPFPIHWWKSIGPWVVSAVKLGASSPIRSAMAHLRWLLTGGRSRLGRVPRFDPGAGAAAHALHPRVSERLQVDHRVRRGVPALAHAHDRPVLVRRQRGDRLADGRQWDADRPGDVTRSVPLRRAHVDRHGPAVADHRP